VGKSIKKKIGSQKNSENNFNFNCLAGSREVTGQNEELHPAWKIR
jgi:hypothetical protein